ncbi:hypothetical protein ACIQWQ_17525 [Peribacillus frigoritolerans]
MEFGEWDLQVNSINWFSLLQEFKRVIVPGGTMIIFYDIYKMDDISKVAEKLKLKQKKIGILEKTNPCLTQENILFPILKGQKERLILIMTELIMKHL